MYKTYKFSDFVFIKSLTTIFQNKIAFINFKDVKYFDFNVKCLEATYIYEKKKGGGQEDFNYFLTKKKKRP